MSITRELAKLINPDGSITVPTINVTDITVSGALTGTAATFTQSGTNFGLIVESTGGASGWQVNSAATFNGYGFFNIGGTEVARLTSQTGGGIDFGYGASGTKAFGYDGSGNVSMNGTLGVTGVTTLGNQVLGDAGTAAAPHYSFTSAPDAGLYYLSGDIIGISTGGGLTVSFDPTATNIQQGDFIVSAGSATFSGDVTTSGTLTASSAVSGQSQLIVTDLSGASGNTALFTMGGYTTTMGHDTNSSFWSINSSLRGFDWYIDGSNVLKIASSGNATFSGNVTLPSGVLNVASGAVGDEENATLNLSGSGGDFYSLNMEASDGGEGFDFLNVFSGGVANTNFGYHNGSGTRTTIMRWDENGAVSVDTGSFYVAGNVEMNSRVSAGGTGTGNAVFTVYSGDIDSLRTVRLQSAGAVTSGEFIQFVANSAQIGSISASGSTVAYNTSSDYRLKNITGPITTSGAYIDSLNPVEGTWKVDGSTFVGLIAHEAQEASRTRVATGEKDGEEMQGMDYSSPEIIANLIAEAQSLRVRTANIESWQDERDIRINELTAEVTALKSEVAELRAAVKEILNAS